MKKFNSSAFSTFPELQTKRLHIREILPTDAPALFAMQSDALVFKYIAKPLQTELAQTESLIQNIREAYEREEMLCWAATKRAGQGIIGTCGFNRLEKAHRRAEIGGSLSPRFWGAGIAQEAVQAIIQYGFEGLNLHTIEARIDGRNRSARYLLQQLGFEKEAHFKDRFYYENQFHDLEVWTLFGA